MSPLTRRALIALAVPSLLSGGIARASNSATTTPVGIASATTNAKRDRDVRRHESRLEHLKRKYDHHRAQCMHGEEEACEQARIEYGEMQDLPPLISTPPR